ncbi:MAG: DUF1559 domain-containing protein [Planctomycetaceae bacterium]
MRMIPKTVGPFLRTRTRLFPAILLLSVFATCVSPSAIAQDAGVKNVIELPDDFDQLIQAKTGLLGRFQKLRQSGPRDEELSVLFTIVNIHRKALKIAIDTKRGASDVQQLQNVYLSDGEFLSDQLAADGNYKQASQLRSQLESFAESLGGKDSNVAKRLHWKAITATKLAGSSSDQQTAYRTAINRYPAIRQAIQSGQAADAEKALQELVNVETEVIGENHPELAIHLNELGRTQFMQRKFEVAEKTYRRSIAAREGSTGKDLQVATTLFNLGRLFQETKRLDDAEQQYLAASKIEESILGPSHKSLIQTMQQLASVYKAKGDQKQLDAIEKRIASADPFNAILAYAPRNTYSGFVVEPAAMLKDPGLELMPFEVIEAAGREELGFNPLDAEAFAGFFTLPIGGEPEIVFAFRLRSGAATTHDWSKGLRTDKVKGATFLSDQKDKENNFVKMDDGTYLFGTSGAVEQALTAAGPCFVTQLLAQNRGKGQLVTAFDVKSLRAVAQAAIQEAPPLPEPFEQLKTLPDMIDGLYSQLNLSGGLQTSITMVAADAASANKSAAIIDQSMQAGIQMAIPQIEQQFSGDTPMERAGGAYFRRLIKSQAASFRPVVKGNTVVINADVGQSVTAPVLIALILPAVQQAREAARRVESRNSLKQLTLGMLNYHDIYQKFPAAASVDKNGKPLLSWRVQILPFVDEGELYKKFRLDEPWDSEHNLPLANEIPRVFVSASHPLGHKTIYQVFTGASTLFPQPGKALSIGEIKDGASNTILIVEANPDQAVVWTQPEDIAFNSDNPMQHVGKARISGFQAALVDGSVRFLSEDLEKNFFSWFVQPADGNVAEELP